MLKQKVIAELASSLDISQKECKRTFDAFIEELICVLEEGKQYTQTGFGAFRTSTAKERIGRNPLTRQKMRYPKKIKMKFRLSAAFKAEINE